MKADLDSAVAWLKRHAGLLAGALLGIVGGLGVFGLILGGLIGYLIDELRSKMGASRNIDRFFLTSDRTELDDRTVWLASITALSGTVIARAHGWNIPRFERVLMCERIAATFSLTGGERDAVDQFSVRLFHHGKPAITSICSRFHEVCADEDECDRLILLLYRVAPGEGESVTGDQDELIESIAEGIGVSSDRFAMLRKASVPTDEQAYRVLGVDPSTDSDEIKRVYRRLASQFHPDSATELDERQQRQTEEAFIRIQNAYQRITAESQRRTDGRRTDSGT